jgi:hypothetical protein
MALRYVNPTLGTDDASHGGGTGAQANKTLAYAGSQIASGDTIELEDGDYLHADEGDIVISDKAVTIHGSENARVFATLKIDSNGTQRAVTLSGWTLDGTGAGNTTTSGGTKTQCCVEDADVVFDGFRVVHAGYNGITVRADVTPIKASVRNCYVQCGESGLTSGGNGDCISAEAASAALGARSAMFVRGLIYGGHGIETNNQVVTSHTGVATTVWEPRWTLSDGVAIAGDGNTPVSVIGGDIQFQGAALAKLCVVAQIVVGLRTNGTIRWDRNNAVISHCEVKTTNASAVIPSVAGLTGATIQFCTLISSGLGETVDLGSCTNGTVRFCRLIYSGPTTLNYGTCRVAGSGLVFEYNHCTTSSHVLYSSTGAITIKGNAGINTAGTSQRAIYVPSFTSCVIDANVFDGFTGLNVIAIQSASGDTTCKVTGNGIRGGSRGIQIQGASAGGGTCTYTIASNAMSGIVTNSIQIVANSQTMTASNCGNNALSKSASGYTLATGDSATAAAEWDALGAANPCGDLLQGIDGLCALPLAMMLGRLPVGRGFPRIEKA